MVPNLLNSPSGADGVQNEKPWHRAAAYMLAAGSSSADVANAFDKSPNTISNLLRTPWFQERITQIQSENGGRDIMTLLKGEAITSLAVMVAIRDDKEAPKAVRANICKDILDRHLGKPVQRVESDTTVRSADPVEEEKQLINQIRFLDGL